MTFFFEDFEVGSRHPTRSRMATDADRTEVELIGKRRTSRPDRGLVIFRGHVHNQHGEEVFRNDKHAPIRCRAAG